MSKDFNDFTNGNITSKLIRFMLPILGALVLQAMYGAIDLAIVGRFGTTEGISGVATGSQVMHFVTQVTAALATGLTVLIARYIGEKSEEKISPLLGGSICLFLILIGIITLILVAFPHVIASWMNAPAEAIPLTVSYLRVCGIGSVFVVSYNLIGSIFRGIGDSRSPLLFVLVACIVNIVGDLLFVAVFHMDATGAAIATVIAQAVSVVLSLIYIKRHNAALSLRLKDLRFNADTLSVLRIGSPIAIQEFLTQFSFLILNAFINGLGLLASSGYGVACKVLAFIMLIPAALMQSMAAFVSQNVGAKKETRAQKALISGILFGSCLGIFVAIGTFFFGDHLAAIFTNDSDVIAKAWEYLRGVCPEAFLAAISFAFIGFFNGHDRTVYVLIQGMAQTFLIRIPISYVMSRQPDASLTWVAAAAPAATIFGIILHLIYSARLRRSGKL